MKSGDALPFFVCRIMGPPENIFPHVKLERDALTELFQEYIRRAYR
jgi:hypothetical protein